MHLFAHQISVAVWRQFGKWPLRLGQLLCILLLLPAAEARGQTYVEFELITEPGFPITGAQEWTRVFGQFPGTSMKLRSGRGTERGSAENLGSEDQPRYRVVGVLTRRNRLRLPNAPEYGPADKKRIQEWIDTLRQEGTIKERLSKVAFGLRNEELVAFHEQMAIPIDFATDGRRAGDVARQIVRELGVKVEVSTKARQAFARNEAVGDELRSLSRGTALAAVLRPLGAATAPKKVAGEIKLVIADARELDEWWPIGWPPQQPPYKTAPTLFDYLEVEITDTPLKTALGAIQGRVKIPFLLDHNSLAREDIDPAASSVNFPKKRTMYKKIIDNTLFQALLRSELRTDDSGAPFLWITTAKRGR